MFNYQARWDKQLPAENQKKSEEEISVACFFDKGKIFPLYFVWKNRTIRIKKINFRWKDKLGSDTLSLFSVKTEEGTFEIGFSQKNMCWSIKKLLAP